jgi:hypothetical protein
VDSLDQFTSTWFAFPDLSTGLYPWQLFKRLDTRIRGLL